MNAHLGFHVAIGIVTDQHEGNTFQAGLVSIQNVQQLDFEIVRFSPAGVHPEEHFGPVLGVGAAGTGVNGNNGVVAVKFTVQQGLDPESFQIFLKAIVGSLNLRYQTLVLCFGSQLYHDFHILQIPFQTAEFIHFIVQGFLFLQQLLGRFMIIPEIFPVAFFFHFFQLCF